MTNKGNWRPNPLAYARNLTFLLLLAIDFKHTYEFVMSFTKGAQANQPVILFGPIFTWVGIPLTNGVFDAMGYAFIVTATIYFMSNTLAKRLAHNHPSIMYYAAMVVGVGLSALTNAGTMYYSATGTLIIPSYLIGWVAAGLGAVVTAGLLMFASMDAWDMKARVQKAASTRQRNRELRDVARMEELRKAKFTPAKYRKQEVAG